MRRGFLTAPQLLCIFNLVNRRKRHSPHIRVGCAFSLLLLYKEKDGIHMPIWFIDDFEGGVAGEKAYKPGLGDYVFAADFDGFEVLFLNVVKHHSFRVADSFSIVSFRYFSSASLSSLHFW